jgi:hypothetical protein
MAGEFYIDEHATLFALIAREAVTCFGEEGESAARRAVAAYCMERGARMAMRCVADGEPLTMANYVLYGEWDDPRGESKAEIAAFEPNYRTNVTACGWCEAWRKRGLLEWGKIYCDSADEHLVRGFNPALELRMGKIMSRGEGVCEFDWRGCDFRDAPEIARRRREKLSRVTKDFLYHCGHLLASARREIIFELGLARGEEIISNALSEFKNIFGALKKNILIEETYQNFLPLSLKK